MDGFSRLSRKRRYFRRFEVEPESRVSTGAGTGLPTYLQNQSSLPSQPADVFEQDVDAATEPNNGAEEGGARAVSAREEAESAASAAASPNEPRPTVTDIIETFKWFAEGYLDLLASDKPPLTVQALETQLCEWLESLHKALGIISSELGGDAKLTKELKQAYVEAVENAVAAASKAQKVESQATGKPQEITSHWLYQTYRDLIYEWAWPLDKMDPAASKLTATLSANEAKSLTVLTSMISDPRELFRLAPPKQEGFSVRFNTISMPDKIKEGLTNIANVLAPREPNFTVTLALDLEPYGGDYSAYRFTHVKHLIKGVSAREILVEHLGSIGVEGLMPSLLQPAQKKFKAHGFKRGAGISDEEFEKILEAVELVPDSILSLVDGIVFQRVPKAAKAKDDASPEKTVTLADYSSLLHKITIYDSAFESSSVGFGTPGTGLATGLAATILHEIGHAVDRLPLRMASAIGRASTTSVSGIKYEASLTTGMYEKVTGPAVSGDFQKAAKTDGARITRYSNESWEEYFAEAFALYISDPATLKRLRPTVFEFFRVEYPTPEALKLKPVKPKPTRQGTF